MDVTIDIKSFFIVLVLIALVVLLVYGIILMRKLLVTIERTNKVLSDVETISELAASRSQDLDGIVDNVSTAASELSEAMSGTSFISAVSNVAKSAASLRGMFAQGEQQETRAARNREKKSTKVRK